MSFDLTQNIKIVNPYADLDELYGPYETRDAALLAVKEGLRKPGKTLGIIEAGKVTEYWFRQGILDSDLELKTADYEEKDTLSTVTERGNVVSGNVIKFMDNGNANVGVKPSTYSFYWGNMSPEHTGTYNIGIGFGTLKGLTSGESNVGIGHYVLKSNNTGSGNTVVGSMVLSAHTSGKYNTVVGNCSGYNMTEGDFNDFIGNFSGYGMVTGYKNVIIGSNAGERKQSGNYNVIIGNSANVTNPSSVKPTGNKNIFIGALSAQNVSGDNNVLIGVAAGRKGTGEVTMNNKLIIHSDVNFQGSTGIGHGVNLPETSTLGSALVTGDFSEKWFQLNGKLIVNPAYVQEFNEDIKGNLVINQRGEIGIGPSTNSDSGIDGIWDFTITDRNLEIIDLTSNK